MNLKLTRLNQQILKKDDIKLKGSKLITSFFKGITKNLKLIFESSNDIENRQDFLCVEGNRKVFNSVMEF